MKKIKTSLDLRTPDEWANWNIPDARLQTVEQIEGRLESINRQRNKLNDRMLFRYLGGKQQKKKHKILFMREQKLIERLRSMESDRQKINNKN